MSLFIAHSASAQWNKAFGRLYDQKSGPLGGVFSGSGASGGDFELDRKMACSFAGPLNCQQADRLGCSRTSVSVIPNAIECWDQNEKSFSLKDEFGRRLTNETYFQIANLRPNNTGRALKLSKKTSGAVRSSLLDEDGALLADGDRLDCDRFESKGEDQVVCVRGSQRFVLKISDLERARNSSVLLKDIADDLSVNLCGVAQRKFRKVYLASFRSFEADLGSAGKVSLRKGRSGFTQTCTSEAFGDLECSGIYVSSRGLECHKSGAVVAKKEFPVANEAIAALAKEHVFRGKSVVPMEDVTGATGFPDYLVRIEKPDHLYTVFMTSGSSGRVPPKSGQK